VVPNSPYLNLKIRRGNQVFHKILLLDLESTSIFKNTFINHSVTSVNQVHSLYLLNRTVLYRVAFSKIPQINASLIFTLLQGIIHLSPRTEDLRVLNLDMSAASAVNNHDQSIDQERDD